MTSTVTPFSCLMAVKPFNSVLCHQSSAAWRGSRVHPRLPFRSWWPDQKSWIATTTTVACRNDASNNNYIISGCDGEDDENETTSTDAVKRKTTLLSPQHKQRMTIARDTVSKLAKQKRSAWTRLGPVIDLALRYYHYPSKDDDDDASSSTDDKENENKKDFTSMADIGTDHGLVAFALAMATAAEHDNGTLSSSSSSLSTVTGVDVSAQALQNGALATLAYLKEQETDVVQIPSKLQFRVGDGLRGLHPGEADIVCLAGMGVNTMIQILSQTTVVAAADTLESNDQNDRSILGMDKSSAPLLLHSLQTNVVVAQPTNTRPRNLIRLYQFMYSQGMEADHEILVQLAGRWYVTTSFVKTISSVSLASRSPSNGLPIEHFPLMRYYEYLNETDDNKTLWQGYVAHHCRWLESELQTAGQLRGREDEWLQHFQSL